MGLSGGTFIGPNSRDEVTLKRVFCTSTEALKRGYPVCYDRDNITALNNSGSEIAASSASWARHRYVEKPAAGNLHRFAGIVHQDHDANSAGQFITIEVATGFVTEIWTGANCTIDSTVLGPQAASWEFGTTTEVPVALALQTVDRSSTSGLVQAQVNPSNAITQATGIATPSSTSNTFSPAVWGAAPWEDVVLGRVRGTAIFEDFKGNYALAANQAVTALGDHLAGFTDGTAGSTITQLTTDPNGVLRLSTTTDNEDIGICIGNASNVAAQFKFSSDTKLYMEARIRVANITDSKAGLFIGFGEEALASNAGIISTGDALADKDLVGFFKVSADGDALDVVHNTASGGGVTTAGADACTLAAATWTNVAIYSDGTTAYFYQDGVLVDSVLLAATNFPDGEEVAFYFVTMNTGGDDWTADIDWAKLLYIP
jgi:hypothetical protein